MIIGMQSSNSSINQQVIKQYQDQIKEMKKELRAHVGQNKDLQGLIRRNQQHKNQHIKSINDQNKQLIADNQDIKGLIRKQEQQISQFNKQINHNKQSSQLQLHYQEIKGILTKHQDQLHQQMKQSYKIIFIERYKKKYQKLAQLIAKQQQEINGLIETINYDICIPKAIQQLKQYKNVVHIDNYSRIDQYKEQIEQYQQDSKQYRIWIEVGQHRLMESKIGFKDGDIRLLRMIKTVDADSNVGQVQIRLYSDNNSNSEVLTAMISRFSNVYSIAVSDWNDQIDNRIHNIIKQWIQQQPIMRFELRFNHGHQLYSNDDGYRLMKQYNQLIKQKQYLGYLWYQHDRIGGWNCATTKQKVEELVNKVDRI